MFGKSNKSPFYDIGGSPEAADYLASQLERLMALPLTTCRRMKARASILFAIIAFEDERHAAERVRSSEQGLCCSIECGAAIRTRPSRSIPVASGGR